MTHRRVERRSSWSTGTKPTGCRPPRPRSAPGRRDLTALGRSSPTFLPAKAALRRAMDRVSPTTWSNGRFRRCRRRFSSRFGRYRHSARPGQLRSAARGPCSGGETASLADQLDPGRQAGSEPNRPTRSTSDQAPRHPLQLRGRALPEGRGGQVRGTSPAGATERRPRNCVKAAQALPRHRLRRYRKLG